MTAVSKKIAPRRWCRSVNLRCLCCGRAWPGASSDMLSQPCFHGVQADRCPGPLRIFTDVEEAAMRLGDWQAVEALPLGEP